MIPASKRAKTVHDLDHMATISGRIIYLFHIITNMHILVTSEITIKMINKTGLSESYIYIIPSYCGVLRQFEKKNESLWRVPRRRAYPRLDSHLSDGARVATTRLATQRWRASSHASLVAMQQRYVAAMRVLGDVTHFLLVRL
jgi:hypothetical protein